MKLSDYFEKRYVPDRLLGSEPLTIEQYRVAIRIASKVLGHQITTKDLNQETILLMVTEFQHDRSPATINRNLRHIAAIWNHAHKNKLTRTAPCNCQIREPEQFKKAWTVDELSAILRAASFQKGMVDSVKASDWWRAIILAFYDTGVRKRAMLHIPMTGVDLGIRAILIPGRFQKQKRDQWCAISTQAVEAIQVIMAPKRERLFPWPWDKSKSTRFRTLDTRFHGILKLAGLDGEHGLFHRVRRSRASYGELVCPGSATEDLGHTERKVTLRYIDPRITGISRTVDLIPRPQV